MIQEIAQSYFSPKVLAGMEKFKKDREKELEKKFEHFANKVI